jgi:hypothetical protein
MTDVPSADVSAEASNSGPVQGEKSVVAACALSLLLPGGGLYYVGHHGTATGFLIAELATAGLIAYLALTRSEYPIGSREREASDEAGYQTALLFLGIKIAEPIVAGVAASHHNSGLRMSSMPSDSVFSPSPYWTFEPSSGALLGGFYSNF